MTSPTKKSKSSRSSAKPKRKRGSTRTAPPVDYRLEHDPAFLERIASARTAIHAGRGVRLESIPD